MKLSLSHDENKIYFKNEEYGFLGYTTFEIVFWNWISKVSWTVNTKKFLAGKKTYIKTSNKNFLEHSALHQSVMVHWYGFDEFLEARGRDFIVRTIKKEGCVGVQIYSPPQVQRYSPPGIRYIPHFVRKWFK